MTMSCFLKTLSIMSLAVFCMDASEAMQREQVGSQEASEGSQKKGRRRLSAADKLGNPPILETSRRRKPVQHLADVRRVLREDLAAQQEALPSKKAPKRPASPDKSEMDDAESIHSLPESASASGESLSSWSEVLLDGGEKAPTPPPTKRYKSGVLNLEVISTSAAPRRSRQVVDIMRRTQLLKPAERVLICQELVAEVGGDITLTPAQVSAHLRRLEPGDRAAILSEWRTQPTFSQGVPGAATSGAMSMSLTSHMSQPTAYSQWGANGMPSSSAGVSMGWSGFLPPAPASALPPVPAHTPTTPRFKIVDWPPLGARPPMLKPKPASQYRDSSTVADQGNDQSSLSEEEN